MENRSKIIGENSRSGLANFGSGASQSPQIHSLRFQCDYCNSTSNIHQIHQARSNQRCDQHHKTDQSTHPTKATETMIPQHMLLQLFPSSSSPSVFGASLVVIQHDNARGHSTKKSNIDEPIPALCSFSKALRKRKSAARPTKAAAFQDTRWEEQVSPIATASPTGFRSNTRSLENMDPGSPYSPSSSPRQTFLSAHAASSPSSVSSHTSSSFSPCSSATASPRMPRRKKSFDDSTPEAVVMNFDRSPRKPTRRTISPRPEPKPTGPKGDQATASPEISPSDASTATSFSPYYCRRDTPRQKKKQPVAHNFRQALQHAVDFCDLDGDAPPKQLPITKAPPSIMFL